MKQVTKYDDKTIEFMKGWKITPEQNEQLLEKVESGELIKLSVGSDTGIRQCLEYCKKTHNGKYDVLYKCEVCRGALNQCDVLNVYLDGRIDRYTNREKMITQIDKILPEIDKKLKVQKEKRKEIEEAWKQYRLAKKIYNDWQKGNASERQVKMLAHWKIQKERYEQIIILLSGVEKGEICKNCESITNMVTYDGCYGCSSGE